VPVDAVSRCASQRTAANVTGSGSCYACSYPSRD